MLMLYDDNRLIRTVAHKPVRRHQSRSSPYIKEALSSRPNAVDNRASEYQQATDRVTRCLVRIDKGQV